MSGGEIAGLIAAGAFAVLVLVACYVLLKMGRIFDETAARVRQTTATIDEGTARVKQAGETVDEVNTVLAHVNVELAKVETITNNVEAMSTNVAALTSLFAATLGGPVVKVAAFSYGVRRAAARRARGEFEAQVRDQLRAERAASKAAKAARRGR
jgi:uncharacterized protein YoxC